MSEYDPDHERDHLVWVASPTSRVFHVLPHGWHQHDFRVEWTREFAEDGLELRGCRNGCFDSDGRLTADARAYVVAMHEVDAGGESLRALHQAVTDAGLWPPPADTALDYHDPHPAPRRPE